MKFAKYLFPLLLTISNVVFAQDFQAKFRDWSVYKNDRGDQVICYVISTPIKSDNPLVKRGEPFLMVTNIENDADEVSVSGGIEYKKTSDVEFSFGATKFYLFPYISKAWANDKNEDIEIIKQMQQNPDLVVTAFGNDDNIFHDTYSLLGFGQAYSKMKTICKD